MRVLPARSEKSQGDKVLGSKRFQEEVHAFALRVSRSRSTVLITGETGTGKSLLARIIASFDGDYSARRRTLALSEVPPALFESELFGRKKGSFTGADEDFEGKVMAANQGTLILEDINCLPLHLQSKLLRLMQDGEFERIGDTQTVRADIRFIVTSNEHLPQLVRESRFRKDLYFRIRTFELALSPLRRRKADILSMYALTG